MKNLKSYVLPYWKSYIFAIVSLILAILLEMLTPQITRVIVNESFVGGDFSRFGFLLGALVVLGAGRSLFGYCKEFTFDRNSQTIGTEMRKDLFAHLQTLSMDYFDNTNTGELMARVKEDVDKVKDAFGMTGMLIIQITLYIISVLYCMFSLSPLLGLLPLAVMIFGGGLSFALEKKFDKVYSDISEENARLTTVAEENLAGVRTVKAFAREKFEIQKFAKHNKHYYELNMEQARIVARYYPIYHFIGAVLPVVCAILGGLLVIQNKMDLGSLVAFVEYSRDCTWPLDMFAELANELSSSFASYKKIKAIADEKPRLVQSENAVHLDRIQGDLRFENVALTLDGNTILSGIDIKLPRGGTLGIMGATGSGKSSLINLLQRFYDPSEGNISIDGTDLRDMELSQVRATSAVVMQDVFLFSDTIEENIKMGKRYSMGLPEVKRAAKMAQAQGFIEKMDDQYNTVIGEKGVGLSGGQKQRISIARALSKKSPILVLDDSTSALDMETEHEIQKMLKTITDSSKIIIAHRISAVRGADEIIYLDKGRIAERGTHEELLALKGLYYATYMAQYPEHSPKKEVI
ncbi:MAG: ABC transporter ATP-binding protein/permease [Acetatifactor sp.]